jgi:hypothetical protein
MSDGERGASGTAAARGGGVESVAHCTFRNTAGPPQSRPPHRNREANTSITARIDLFWHFKGTMTSYLSFRAAGPSSGINSLHTGTGTVSGSQFRTRVL